MILSTQEVFEVLQKGYPVAVVRAGDGENIVLNGFADHVNFAAVMKRQLGFYPPIDHCQQIIDNLKEAYKGADIIGIPMHKNLDALNHHWQGVSDNVNQYAVTDKRCSIDVCYDMLYEGLLTEWLKEKRVINYISCRTLPFERRWGTSQVNHFKIAPECKFTTYQGEPHYPDQFNRIHRWMDKCAVEGNPCLVGAGVIGKLYVNWFRDRGGVAIDIGAVFDLWAGKATRGPKRGLDAVDETYRL